MKDFPIEDEAAAQYSRSDYERSLINTIACLRTIKVDVMAKEIEVKKKKKSQ